MRRSIAIVVVLFAAVAAAPARAYDVPADNPFVNTPGARGEIYDFGLRNPFRWSFDRITGDVVIGDVGENEREEIDFVPKGSTAGLNFGWSCREGTIDGPSACSAPNATEPSYDYGHGSGAEQGSAVTGGYVVRDPDLPAWQGRYLFGDISNPNVRWLAAGASGPEHDSGLDVPQLTSLGEDGVGHLYATSLTGPVLRLAQAGGGLKATPIGSFSQPMAVTAPPGDPDRLFIAERTGTVRLRVNGVLHDFLSVQTTTDVERGLLSVAVAPNYAFSGKVFVYYTDLAGNLQLDEFTRSAGDPTRADPASRVPMLTIPHPDGANHNGGTLQFGPDGYLYLSTGDGGGPDVDEDAQSLGSLLGKVLRIDAKLPQAGLRQPLPGGGGVVGDVTAPVLRVRLAERQRVLRLKGVVAYGRCNERCALTLAARVRLGKRLYRLRAAKRTAAAGKRVRLKATLGKRGRRALRRVQRHEGRPTLRLTLTARDRAGNKQVVRRVVHVKR